MFNQQLFTNLQGVLFIKWNIQITDNKHQALK
jgi:hypothetical protein